MTTRLDDLLAIVGRLAAPFERFGVHRRGLDLQLRWWRVSLPFGRKGRLVLESWRGRSAKRPGWRIVLPIAAIALGDRIMWQRP